MMIRASRGGKPKRARWLRTSAIVAGSVVLAALWWFASVPWGLPLLHVVPFVGPGALLGLGAGWASQAATKWRWTWQSAARWAIGGGVGLAPILVFFVGIEGNLHPEQLLAGYVRGAWVALAFGALIAGVRAVRLRRARRAADATALAPPASQSTRRRA